MVCHWEDSDAVIQEMFANVGALLNSLIYKLSGSCRSQLSVYVLPMRSGHFDLL